MMDYGPWRDLGARGNRADVRTVEADLLELLAGGVEDELRGRRLLLFTHVKHVQRTMFTNMRARVEAW